MLGLIFDLTKLILKLLSVKTMQIENVRKTIFAHFYCIFLISKKIQIQV